MSPSRRTFCLMTVFDLILTFILWVIYVEVSVDPNTEDALKQEVLKYTFKTSLFDTVMCAAWRCVPLLLLYGLWRINKPWGVAVTTLGTCVFLVTKVFLFDFHKPANNEICYLLLISSFIIAWAETWFLDFKVLPREEKARQRDVNKKSRQSGPGTDGDKVSLKTPRSPCPETLRFPQAADCLIFFDLETTGLERFHGTADERRPLLPGAPPHYQHNPPEQYYSPANSEASDEESHSGEGFRSLPQSRGHSRQHSHGSIALSLGGEEKEYLEKARKDWDYGWELLHDMQGWAVESGKDHHTGIVKFKNIPKMGKVFRLEGYIDSSPQAAFEQLVVRQEDTHLWNPTVLECRTLQVIDESTDISYNVAAEAAGGIVSSRDFVNLRHWETRNGIIFSAGSSVSHPEAPPCKTHVRGENLSGGGWAFLAVPGNPDKCLFNWIINTNLKGWIPQYVVDQAFSMMLMDFLKHLRQRMVQIREEAPSSD